MEKLILNGKELPWDQELEIFNHEFGFNVAITLRDDIKNLKGEIHPWAGKTEYINNCTEVHHLYNKNRKWDEPKSAFESDIHSTGCTKKVSRIAKIVIITATKIEEEY